MRICSMPTCLCTKGPICCLRGLSSAACPSCPVAFSVGGPWTLSTAQAGHCSPLITLDTSMGIPFLCAAPPRPSPLLGEAGRECIGDIIIQRSPSTASPTIPPLWSASTILEGRQYFPLTFHEQHWRDEKTRGQGEPKSSQSHRARV